MGMGMGRGGKGCLGEDMCVVVVVIFTSIQEGRGGDCCGKRTK